MTAATRSAVVPLLLLLPVAFFAAGALGAYLATRAATLMAPEPVTLLEAVELKQDEAIFRMVSAGEDPGRPVVLERPLLHWRKGDTTSPLLVAVVDGEINLVAYLVKSTGHLADPPNDRALCLAAQFQHANIARFLMKIGAPAVPKEGCGVDKPPEDVAKKSGAGQLVRELHQYRKGDPL
jgi:hypothetical protein